MNALKLLRLAARRTSGSLILLLGVLLTALAAVTFLGGMAFAKERPPVSPLSLLLVFLVILVVPMVVGFTGSFLIQWGQSLWQLTADERMAFDTRAPVLILRSFEDDCSPIRPMPIKVSMNASLWRTKQVSTPLSFERILVDVFERVGPVIAVGRPGERFSPMGAGRMYVGADWFDRVKRLIDIACVVLLIPGGTKGVQDELQAMLEVDRHRKLVILFPPVWPDLPTRWQAVRSIIAPYLEKRQVSLPITPPTGTIALSFDDSLSPHVISSTHNEHEYAHLLLEVARQFQQAHDEEMRTLHNFVPHAVQVTNRIHDDESTIAFLAELEQKAKREDRSLLAPPDDEKGFR